MTLQILQNTRNCKAFIHSFYYNKCFALKLSNTWCCPMVVILNTRLTYMHFKTFRKTCQELPYFRNINVCVSTIVTMEASPKLYTKANGTAVYFSSNIYCILTSCPASEKRKFAYEIQIRPLGSLLSFKILLPFIGSKSEIIVSQCLIVLLCTSLFYKRSM